MNVKRVIYGVPNSDTPSGGVKVIYRHSEILNKLGVFSGVWHPNDEKFKCTWFDNNIKNIDISQMDPANDFIILPEIWASTHVSLFKNLGFKIGIYVQNCYYTNFNLNVKNKNAICEAYEMADIVLSISQDTSKYLKDVFKIPSDKIQLQRYSVDGRLFKPQNKGKIITYMPRKMSEHSSRVVGILNDFLPSDEWIIKAIDKMSEQKVAIELSNSIIFLAFSEFEGLPVPPVEAALSGNFVIGYHGQGGKEYWHQPNFTKIEQGDIQRFVFEVKNCILKIESGEIDLDKINLGIEQLANYFSPENEVDLLKQLIVKINFLY